MPHYPELSGQHEAPRTPLTDAALALYVEKPTGGEQLIDETILDGEGVPQEFITSCKQLVGRLKGYPSILDYHTFPRDLEGPTYRFFSGEDFQYKHMGGANEVNNPMRLIRPKILASPSTMTYHGISPYTSSPNIHAKNVSERGYEDSAHEALYARAITQYEELFITVLETTNMASADDRNQHVNAKLAEIFDADKSNAPSFARHNKVSDLKSETPAGWVAHATLAVLLHPSEAITPAARIRALGLLKLYPPDELQVGFGGGNHSNGKPNYFGSGLMSAAVKMRLPHTMCGPNERYQDEHAEWETNEQLSPILNSVKVGDYRSAANEVLSKPFEAVQLSVLMLRLYGKEGFALGLLRTIPDLDRKTQALMFGNRATFYTDNTISNNLEDQIAEGAGTRFDPTATFDGMTAEMLESSTPAALKRYLASAILRLRTAEELTAKLAGETRVEQPRAQERKDPDGLCAVLGINPDILSSYTDDEITVILSGAARTMSKIAHPDIGDASDAADRDERQKAINNARDQLSDPAFRRAYGAR